MSGDQDAIEGYLDEVADRLGGSAGRLRRVLAEFEAHLRDAVDAHRAAGMAAAEAQSAALREFGSAIEVADAVNRASSADARIPLLRAAVESLARLSATGLVALGVAAGVARVVVALTSTQAIFGLPSAARVPAAACAHWLAVQPAAASCQRAGTLEASSDLTAALALAGIAGLLLWVMVLLLDRIAPPPAEVLPPVLAPAIGMAGFGAAAVGLAVLALNDAVVFMVWGAGLWWTLAACSLAVATASGGLLARALSGGGGARAPQPEHT